MTGESTAWMARSNQVFIGTYSRFPAVMVEGRGCVLRDVAGREYLDFLAGIAVCALGHCHPAVTRAICEQAGRLVHVSNLFHTVPQTELAELLVANSFADRVFFANSGAEANEAAIKLARKYSAAGRYEIISLAGSFHGRTLATVAATGQSKFHQGFEPLPAGFPHAPFGDLAALESMITPRTCAILCEPLQGESGVRPLVREYLVGIRELCDRYDLLLIFDEVQTGMGRTGTLFAYEQQGVVPDILTTAKALANGLPIGAMLTSEKIAAAFTPGSHASTFGGNPVAAAAAVATLRVLLADGFLAEVVAKGSYFAEQLNALAGRHPRYATGARGSGLLQALILTEAGISRGQEMVNRMFEQGVLINFAGNAVLRFVPPLVVSRAEIDACITALDRMLGGLSD
ncbi:MAG: acetylornithine aminotransferase [Deltaproteobacteria bacterium RIFOXYD12_FULL_57_12]|nr:MAG: acetylornithine aminotransferase [Deltaproteobacteria bacterium RIFOXYD12_FULL_57_12]